MASTRSTVSEGAPPWQLRYNQGMSMDVSQDLAATFHAFYRDCRVVSSEPTDAALTKARLRLAKAAKLALGRTLGLMGVSAPERM